METAQKEGRHKGTACIASAMTPKAASHKINFTRTSSLVIWPGFSVAFNFQSKTKTRISSKGSISISSHNFDIPSMFIAVGSSSSLYDSNNFNDAAIWFCVRKERVRQRWILCHNAMHDIRSVTKYQATSLFTTYIGTAAAPWWPSMRRTSFTTTASSVAPHFFVIATVALLLLFAVFVNAGCAWLPLTAFCHGEGIRLLF